MKDRSLRVYVSGMTPRSKRAIESLRRLCAEELGGLYTLEVIDILENPEVAADQMILVTPTVVKEFPPPLRQVVGDLTASDEVLRGLDLLEQGDRARDRVSEQKA